LGVILILAVGVHSSYLFYGGSRVITTFDVYSQHASVFAGYSSIVQTNGLVYLYYDHTFDTTTLGSASITLGYNLSTSWASVQAISAAGAIDYVRSSVYVLLIASGLIAAYVLVRLN
jgi:hypothetical protein